MLLIPTITSNHTRVTSALCGLGVLTLCAAILLGFTARPSGMELHTIEPASELEPAQECVVTFTTGRRLTGIMMGSHEDTIVLRINGIDTTYRRARIANIKFLPSVEERFTKFRSAIPDEDIEGRLLLVDWLRDRRAYQLAIEELRSILELEPHHPQAKLLKTWLEQHLKLAKSKINEPEPAPKVSIPEPKTIVPLLSDEQVNLIRVYEIDLKNPPKLVIEDNTLRALMRRSPELFPSDERERDAILKWSPIERLRLLFRHKARDLYSEIRVLEDPDAFQDFKKYIAGHTGWLINGCATTRCHGGDQAGDFRLANHNPNSPRSLYTNFLILDRYSIADGTPLINHNEPERSPLIQMGMVRSRSLYPHPDVDQTKFGRDWRPVFRTTKAFNLKRTTDWIRTLYTPRPEYGFEYPPPVEPSP